MERIGEQQPKPGREQLAYAVARVLGEGYVLTNNDLKMMAPHYGVNPRSLSDFMYSPGVRKVMQSADVVPLREDYNSYKVYTDGSRNPIPGELGKTYESIDESRSKFRSNF